MSVQIDFTLLEAIGMRACQTLTLFACYCAWFNIALYLSPISFVRRVRSDFVQQCITYCGFMGTPISILLTPMIYQGFVIVGMMAADGIQSVATEYGVYLPTLARLFLVPGLKQVVQLVMFLDPNLEMFSNVLRWEIYSLVFISFAPQGIVDRLLGTYFAYKAWQKRLADDYWYAVASRFLPAELFQHWMCVNPQQVFMQQCLAANDVPTVAPAVHHHPQVAHIGALPPAPGVAVPAPVQPMTGLVETIGQLDELPKEVVKYRVAIAPFVRSCIAEARMKFPLLHHQNNAENFTVVWQWLCRRLTNKRDFRFATEGQKVLEFATAGFFWVDDHDVQFARMMSDPYFAVNSQRLPGLFQTSRQ